MDNQNPNPDFENIQPKVEITEWENKLCFICLNDDTFTEKEHHDNHNQNHSGYHRYEGERSVVNILISYILRNTSSSSSSTNTEEENREREEIQRNILSSFNKGNQSICSECLSKAENLFKLHFELEKIQMQILDVLRNLQDYLKSVKGNKGHHDDESTEEVNDDVDVMLIRFHDILLHEFMCRELSDGAGAGAGCGGNDPIINITPDIKLDEDDDGYSQEFSQSTIDMDYINDDDEEDPRKESHFEDSDCYPQEGTRRRQAKEKLEMEDSIGIGIGAESSQVELEEGVSVPATPPPARKHGQKGPITWDCEICLEPIPYEKYRRHLKSHPQFEKFYECQVCPPSERTTKRTYGTYKGLVWHYIRKQHKIDMPCKLCLGPEQSILFKKPELCRHLYEVHHINHRKLSCREENCPEEFCDPKTLTCHHSKLHSGSNNDDRGKCPQCMKSILNARLDFHLKYKCGKKSLKEIKSKKERKEALTCPISTCRKRFKLESRRDAHIQVVHPQNLLTCSSCPKQFKTSHGLKIHEATHLGESAKVECPQCQRKFTHRDLLRKHIDRMHLKKPYRKQLSLQCRFCSKIFHVKHHLQLHEQSHQNLRSFKCPEPECEYAANTRAALRNHLKTHQEKTLKCQYCPLKCRTKEHLGNHERTHTKERPFMCPVEGCQMSFRTQSQRGQHVTRRHGIPRQRRINPEKKVKEKVFVCDLCPKQYKDNRDLRRHKEGAHDGNPELVKCLYCEKMFRKHRMHYHVKAVHGEKLFRCGSCEKTFVWEDSLKLHEEQSHGIYK